MALSNTIRNLPIHTVHQYLTNPISMQHKECAPLYKANSFQQDRFWAWSWTLGQLSLAIPSWVGTMSISQAVVTVGSGSWGVKAGMVRVWVAGKTVWSRCYTRPISERFRDKRLYNKGIYKWSIYWLMCNKVWNMWKKAPFDYQQQFNHIIQHAHNKLNLG